MLVLLGMLGLSSCTSDKRLLDFSWATPKQTVLDSVRSWGFTYNEAKARWENGHLNGYACSKLKLWFSEDDKFSGAEAKYLGLSTATSRSIVDRFTAQLREAHGRPTSEDRGAGAIPYERFIWAFSDAEENLQDMIVIAHFSDYVLYHAARAMPKPIDIQATEKEE